MSFIYLDWAILALAATVAALAVMVGYLLNRFQKATRVINNQGEAIDGIMALSVVPRFPREAQDCAPEARRDEFHAP